MRRIASAFILSVLLLGSAVSQVLDEENNNSEKTKKPVPMSIDFSKMFEKKDVPRESYLKKKQQQNTQFVQSLSIEALEKSIDPDTYIVGPGDYFIFVVWGAVEEQFPLEVTPEGILFIPSVGKISVTGKTLTQVRKIVDDKAKKAYKKNSYSLAISSLRLFRVHVVGEVKYPGTYVGRAIDRITDLIDRAGGVSESAWKQCVVQQHSSGKSADTLDLLAYEKFGDLSQNPVVQGGDLIYVPSITSSDEIVIVEGNFVHAGMYALKKDETLYSFLLKIDALKSTSTPSFITVVRKNGEKDKQASIYRPFKDSVNEGSNFILKAGDRIVLPSEYVYVKGAVRNPGAYPYVSKLTAREYAGMAGGDYRSGRINDISVYHALTGKREKGPDVPVYPGDVIHMQEKWRLRMDMLLRLIPTITSLILAAKAAGFLGD